MNAAPAGVPRTTHSASAAHSWRPLPTGSAGAGVSLACDKRACSPEASALPRCTSSERVG